MYGTSFYDSFMIAEVCGMTEKSGSGGSGGKWPSFPCEDPTHPEIDKYFRHFDDEFKNHESIHLIMGTTPPSLIGFSGVINTVALVPIPEPVTQEEIDADSTKAKVERIKFNLQCEQTLRAEKGRQQRYDAGIAELKNQLASIIANTMRDTAPARLRALKKMCEMDTDGKSHDGIKMYTILTALKTEDGPTASRSHKWHEKQFNVMNAEQLPDHCTAPSSTSRRSTPSFRSTSRTSRRFGSRARTCPR